MASRDLDTGEDETVGEVGDRTRSALLDAGHVPSREGLQQLMKSPPPTPPIGSAIRASHLAPLQASWPLSFRSCRSATLVSHIREHHAKIFWRLPALATPRLQVSHYSASS